MKVPVSALIVRYMERLGIDTVFGMPGAHILPVYDALYDSSISTVLAKHEQGAAFMACGYNRASHRITSCITTAGPGATNLITGIANAYADRQPVLVITGETPTYIFGKGGLQESSGEGGSINQAALFESITGYQRVIERTDYLANVLNQASKTLLSETPAPVLLCLPFNVQKEEVELSILDEVYTGECTTPGQINGNRHRKAELLAGNITVDARFNQKVDQFIDLLNCCKKPVIVSGYGCIRSQAQPLVTELSKTLNIPVTSSLKGKGSINECSTLSLGSLGVTSTGYAYDYIVNHSDLVIVLGASFNERTSYLWNKDLMANKHVVQVDIDDRQLNRVYQPDICINADIRVTLGHVLDSIQSTDIDRKQLLNLDEFKLRYEQRAEDEGNALFNDDFSLVKTFFETMNARFENNFIAFDDNIIFAQNLLNVSTGSRFYPNSGISSLGHAIPAAIGAQFANRITTDVGAHDDKTDTQSMFAIIGDGGFQMCCMEIMTAVNYEIPLNIILFNNSSMGLIRKNQIQTYNNRFIDCDFDNPDYKKLADAFGIKHQRIATIEDIETCFTETDFNSGINLIEIVLDKNAFPNYSSRR